MRYFFDGKIEKLDDIYSIHIRLDNDFHAVDFANGVVKAVRAVLVHLDNAAGYV